MINKKILFVPWDEIFNLIEFGWKKMMFSYKKLINCKILMHTTSFLENLVFTDPLSDLCLFAAITSQWSEYKLVIVTGILTPLRKYNLII